MIQPRNDRVLIQRIGDIERIGSIYLPDIAREKAIKGVVLAAGPGKWIPGEWWKLRGKWEWLEGYREAPWVHPGQTVFFNSTWNDAEQPQNDLHIVQFADIYGIVPD